MASLNIARITRRFLIFIVAIAVLAIAPLSFAKTTEAYCGTQTLCLFEHSNFGGAQYNFWDPNPNDDCVTLPSSWKNRASSIINNGNWYVAFYDGDDCNNYELLYVLAPHTGIWSLVPAGANDKIESFIAY